MLLSDPYWYNWRIVILYEFIVDYIEAKRRSFRVRRVPKPEIIPTPEILPPAEPQFPNINTWQPGGDWFEYLTQYQVGDKTPTELWCFSGDISGEVTYKKLSEVSSYIVNRIKGPDDVYYTPEEIATKYFWWSITASLDFLGIWGKWTRFFETDSTRATVSYTKIFKEWTVTRWVHASVSCDGYVLELDYSETPPGGEPPPDAVDIVEEVTEERVIREDPGHISNPDWAGAVDDINSLIAESAVKGYTPSIPLISLEIPNVPPIESNGTIQPKDEIGTSFEAVFETFHDSDPKNDVAISAHDIGTDGKGRKAYNHYIAAQGGDYSVSGISISELENRVRTAEPIAPQVFQDLFGHNVQLPPGCTGVLITSISIDTDVGTVLDVVETSTAHPLVSAGNVSGFGESSRGTVSVKYQF